MSLTPPAPVFSGKIPAFAQSILIASAADAELAPALLEGRSDRTVDAVPVEAGLYDCIIDRSHANLIAHANRLATRGSIVLTADVHDIPMLEKVAPAAGLVLYRQWPLEDETVFLLFPVGYNPLEHARLLLDQGQPAWAYELLAGAPAELLRNPQVFEQFGLEALLCLLAWNQNDPHAPLLERFRQAQNWFYAIIARNPVMQHAYLCQAEFWRIIGDADMARRLLATVQHATPAPEIEQQLTRYPQAPYHRREYDSPAWDGAWMPKVLMLVPPRPHYGLDVLYDGLSVLLGDDAVDEFPWKPSLHGKRPAQFGNYPCILDRPGAALGLEMILERLESGYYGLVLCGDMDGSLGAGDLRQITERSGDTPFILLDQEDDMLDRRAEALSRLTRAQVGLYFKREYLTCQHWGGGVFPLPFAYLDSKALPAWTSTPRPRDLFWAGHRLLGLRRLYLERLEAMLGRELRQEFTQDQYIQALQDARIGLNIFGLGYDTVRYWELPAQGVMLLAERPPIRIPHNFVDGESAVFFDTLEELETKLKFYLDRPEECERIAAAGHFLLCKYHTGSARASQMLGRIQAFLGGY